MSRIEEAVACFAEGFSCAQAVCAVYGPLYGMEREMALRAAGAFGGGMGRSGQTCGAVTGAMIVIGLKHGKIQGLLGCHIGTPEGRALAHEKQLYTTICEGLVRDAAEILEEVLEIKED
jgi:hypothetical protein